jgi:uncharacterized protein (DUF608 family)
VKYAIYLNRNFSAQPIPGLLRLASVLALTMATPSPARTQGKASPLLDAQTGVVFSHQLLSGVPLGGIGAGKVEIMTDGSFARATIMNNWDRPTGALPGCFVALWTRTGAQTSARVLALNSAYGLPTVARLDYDGLAPQAQLNYPDPGLPFAVNLLAFSPLAPFVIKDSSYPAAVLVLRIKNTLPVPIELSAAVSWEGQLGIGSDGRGNAFHNRDGVKVEAIPSAESYFGMRFSSPPELKPSTEGTDAAARQRANASGEMVLMSYPPRPQTIVTTAGWNALDARPGWWDGFAKTGEVSGTVGAGQEGRVHPAAVVAARLTLRPNDYVELPFAVAWYAPHHWLSNGEDAAHFYQNIYADAGQAARQLLDQWSSLHALTEEWQKRLTYSNLPRWLARRLINTVASLTADSVYTQDGRFALLPGVAPLPPGIAVGPPDAGAEAQSDTRQHLAASALLLALFPQLHAQFLTQRAATAEASGAVPPLTGGDLPDLLGPPVLTDLPGKAVVVPASVPAGAPPANLMAAPIDSNSAYVLEAAQYALWTGDLPLLKSIYPGVRGALTALLGARNGKPWPLFPAQPAPHPGSLTLYLAALRAGARLAEMMDDVALAGVCREAAAHGEDAMERDYWNGQCYGLPKQEAGARSLCDIDQLLGQWAADQLDLGNLLPPERFDRALGMLQARVGIETAAGAAAPPNWEPLASTLGVVALTLRQPARAEAGVALWRHLDDQRNTQLRAPWLFPQRLPEPGAVSYALDSDLGDAADWNLLTTIEGFAYDAIAQRMTLRPNLPGTWRTYHGPIFAPTFWADLEYKPTAHGGLLNLRIDRLLAIGEEENAKHRQFVRPELVLRSLRVPGPPLLPGGAPGQPRAAYVSVGLRPIGCRTESDAAGNLTLTFDTPLALSTGDRLQIDVH